MCRSDGAGGCDLRLPVLYGNTPSVLFGPSGAMIHSTDEYIEFEQVIDCARVWRAWRLTGAASVKSSRNPSSPLKSIGEGARGRD